MSTLSLRQPAAAAESQAGTPVSRSQVARGLAYLLACVRHCLSDVSFLFFTVALPVTMYLIFAGIYGDQELGRGMTVAGVMMVTMAAYGGLGAAMNAGFQIHEEQRSGWFRQLSITGLPASTLVVVRILTASVVIVPAIAVLYLVGHFVKQVELPLSTFLFSGVVLWAALLPMVLLGLAIALWCASAAGQALVTIVLMVLSVIGGLWFPVEMMPDWVQLISRFTPSYWIGQLGTWSVRGGDFPARGLATLLIWTLVLAGLCLVGYRRAVQNSAR